MSDNGKPSIMACVNWLGVLEDVSLDKGSIHLDNYLDLIVSCRGYLLELAMIVKSASR